MEESSRQSSSLEAHSHLGHCPTRGSSHRTRCPETRQAEVADQTATTAILLHTCQLRQGLPLSNPPSHMSVAAGTATLKSAFTYVSCGRDCHSQIGLHTCQLRQGLPLSNPPSHISVAAETAFSQIRLHTCMSVAAGTATLKSAFLHISCCRDCHSQIRLHSYFRRFT